MGFSFHKHWWIRRPRVHLMLSPTLRFNYTRHSRYGDGGVFKPPLYLSVGRVYVILQPKESNRRQYSSIQIVIIICFIFLSNGLLGIKELLCQFLWMAWHRNLLPRQKNAKSFADDGTCEFNREDTYLQVVTFWTPKFISTTVFSWQLIATSRCCWISYFTKRVHCSAQWS